MIQPIPKRLLPHNAIYKEYLGNNGEGDEWKQPISLSFVKIEEKIQLKVTSNGREMVGNARLFYDLVNSTGLTNKPIENSIIEFNNKEYKIVNIDVFYPDTSSTHHYEILLK